MKIYLPIEARQEAERIIRAYRYASPSGVWGVRPAGGGSSGYEIPVVGHKKKGRIHILFCSEGVEVHRDYVFKGKHRVLKLSATAKMVHGELKSLMGHLVVNAEKQKSPVEVG